MTDDDPDRLPPSVHLEELDVEDERGAAGDQAAAGARVAVPIKDHQKCDLRS